MIASRIRKIAQRSFLGILLLLGLSAASDLPPFSPALPPPMGRIDISALGADPVQVIIDGEVVTAVTPGIIPVSSGEHIVILRKSGFADLERTLTVEPLETVTLHAEMLPQ
jgi:hypothetical protein